MTDPTKEAVRAEREAQDQLLSQLRGAGKTGEASQLAKGYHGQRMAGLAEDVYESARGEGKPPAGWTRASEHPEQLKALAPQLTDKQIVDMLHPDKSGYRAEIYLPDKSVLGPDAKPVLVFKGSTGMIVDPAAPGGRRESASEDFLANNIPQGLGLKTDYYDRAMNAAVLLKNQPGFKFEMAGHSLAGGMASAASAVTGVETTTFNAAGLHPNTAQRYATEHGLTVYNPRNAVQAFQVGGEMLTDGQGGIQKMNAARRVQAGMLANDVATLMETPGAKEMVQGKIDGLLPPHARRAANDTIDFLATHSGNQALRTLPTAAGDIQPLLAPKTRDAQGHLVNRPNELALSELAAYAGPLTNVLSATAMSARAGRNVGEVVKFEGQIAEQGLHVVGKGLNTVARAQGETNAFVTNTVGTLGSTTVRAGGEVTAQVRLQAGNLEAGINQAQGKTQQVATSWTASALRWGAKILPDDAEKWVGRQAQGIESYGNEAMRQNQREAQQARAAAHGDATVIRQGTQAVATNMDHTATAVANTQRQAGQQTGAVLQQGADAAGHGIRTVTDKAPAAGMVVGGTVGGLTSTVATHLPVNPQNAVNLYQTITVLQRGQAVAGEAVFRHGMAGSVIPSLDAAIDKQERAAKQLLGPAHPAQPIAPQDKVAPSTSTQIPTPIPTPIPQRTGMLLDHPDHKSNSLFLGAEKGVYALDERFNRTPDIGSKQLAGTLTAQAVDAGLKQIHRVELSQDNSRLFAMDTADPNAAHQRVAFTDVSRGMQQSLVASTQQADLANNRVAEQTAQQQALQQPTQDNPVRAAKVS
jgi:hypothetical protein